MGHENGLTIAINRDFELETSLRRIREVVARPSNFHMVTDHDFLDDYMPNPGDIHIRVGDGLVYYKRHDPCLEMFTAITAEDLPDKPIEELHKQWAWLSSLGYYSVFTTVRKGHLRAMMMCRSAGMKKRFDDEVNMYEKVIYGSVCTHGR